MCNVGKSVKKARVGTEPSAPFDGVVPPASYPSSHLKSQTRSHDCYRQLLEQVKTRESLDTHSKSVGKADAMVMTPGAHLTDLRPCPVDQGQCVRRNLGFLTVI